MYAKAAIILHAAMALVLVAVATAADTPESSLQAEAFIQDDECSGDEAEECVLNALQLQAHQAKKPVDTGADESLGEPEDLKLPEGWNKDNDFPDTWNNKSWSDVMEIDKLENWSMEDDFPKVTEETAETKSMDLEPAAMYGSGCRSHPSTHSCYLYRACRGPRYCSISGYMIVPGFAIAGMESINGGNARSLDYLMDAAKSRCGGSSCVLITNPRCCRTQDQLHIHYRHYNGGGAALKSSLERTLCHSHGWKGFNKCGYAKAQIFDYFPDVFSVVAQAYGGGSLSNVGITVWFTSACGGWKTMILATTGCSIEHSISSR